VPAVYHRRAAARPSQRPLGPITECAQPYWRPVRKYPPICSAIPVLAGCRQCGAGKDDLRGSAPGLPGLCRARVFCGGMPQ